MSDSAIKVEGLSKRYRIGSVEGPYRTFRETLVDSLRRPWQGISRWRQPLSDQNSIWALKDISFEIKPGEVVGIIGRNGAGKSTLLKILSRITDPTAGWAEIRGRVGSLLEVGTGFHPELTGRENIFLNGAILGMQRQEIRRSFDHIVSFAEMDKFIDTPVKRYSSGMFMRLAFSVAAHLEPEILLVDEVLAVGDAGFQRKCLGKMGEVAKEGRTVLFVSHSMAAIQSLCGRVLLLREGSVVNSGSTREVIEDYLREGEDEMSRPLGERTGRQGNGEIRITGLMVNGMENRTVCLCSGDRVTFKVAYRSQSPAGTPSFHIGIYDMMGLQIIHCCSSAETLNTRKIGKQGWVGCEIPELPLPPGVYRLNIAVMDGNTLYDYIVGAIELEVEESNFYGGGDSQWMRWGKCLVKQKWTLEDAGS